MLPYGCNDQIKGVGTLSSLSCKDTNILGIFNKQQRRKRSHGHRHDNKKTPQLDSSIDTFTDVIDSIDHPQGVYKIKTTLFSISLPKLRLNAMLPYGCNDQIKGVGTLSSLSCKDTNILGIFNKQQRRKRSHGHRHDNKKLLN